MYGVMWCTSNYSNQLRLYNNLVIIYFEVIPSGVSIIVILPQCSWDLQPCEAIYINYCKIQPFMALAWYSFLGVEEINYMLVKFYCADISVSYVWAGIGFNKVISLHSLQLFTFISMSQRKEFAPKSILLILRCLKIYFDWT